jgi:hypothetical protein
MSSQAAIVDIEPTAVPLPEPSVSFHGSSLSATASAPTEQDFVTSLFPVAWCIPEPETVPSETGLSDDSGYPEQVHGYSASNFAIEHYNDVIPVQVMAISPVSPAPARVAQANPTRATRPNGTWRFFASLSFFVIVAVIAIAVGRSKVKHDDDFDADDFSDDIVYVPSPTLPSNGFDTLTPTHSPTISTLSVTVRESGSCSQATTVDSTLIQDLFTSPAGSVDYDYSVFYPGWSSLVLFTARKTSPTQTTAQFLIVCRQQMKQVHQTCLRPGIKVTYGCNCAGMVEPTFSRPLKYWSTNMT